MGRKRSQERRERLTIYRVRGQATPEGLIIKTDKAKPRVELEISHGSATLYVKNTPPPKLPAWTNFLIDGQKIEPDLFGGNRSEGAALVVRDLGDTFVLCFGMGFHLVNLDLVERDFGLRVTLNSVNPERLRSLDKASYQDNWLNTRNQSPRDSDIFDLAIDWEIDMVQSLTGACQIGEFGPVATGRDALTIHPTAKLNDLHAIFQLAQEACDKKLPDRFAWVDNVHRIKEREMIELLDSVLDDLIKTDPENGNFWMGEPEIVDWERQAGYSFERRASSASHPTLQLEDFLGFLRERKLSPGVAAMKTHVVHSVDANGEVIQTWRAYRCLYAEIKESEKTYVLRDGQWHEINKNFIDRVDAFLARLEVDTEKLPIYNHANEGEYNSFSAKTESNIELLDKKNIQIGGPHDKIEFCDLIRSGKDLIHVKYYRSSATLSHLFSQGEVSGETFIKDEDFRNKLNAKLPESIRLADPSKKPNAQNYRVIFAIATSKNLPLDLPFFSKITLKNSFMTLDALNFKVAIAKIEVEPTLLKTKSFKSAKRKGITTKI